MDRSTESLAKVRELTVIYSSESGEPVRALDAVGIDVHSGEIVGILGESGSGKSTLANAMLRLLAPHARCEGGTILFRGRDLMNLSQSELRAIRGRDISLIPQDPALALNPVMTTGAQIDEVLRAHLPLNAHERRTRVRSCFGRLASTTWRKFTRHTLINSAVDSVSGSPSRRQWRAGRLC